MPTGPLNRQPLICKSQFRRKQLLYRRVYLKKATILYIFEMPKTRISLLVLGLALASSQFLCVLSQTASPQDERQCFGNPAGRLSVDVVGVPGAMGEKGQKGSVGGKGERGLPGVGRPGLPGLRGDLGSRGDRGERGAPGPSGPQGPKGSRGGFGLPGEQGEKGSIGEKGRKGDAGMASLRGLPGTKGDKGSRGPTGHSGGRGLKGSMGPPGPQGPPGQTTLPPSELAKLSEQLTESFAAQVAGRVQQLEEEVRALRAVLFLGSNFTSELEANNGQKCNTSTIGITVPAQNCSQVFSADPSCVTGIYLLAHGKKSVLAYCERPRELCGITGQWRRVGYLNMEESEECPSGLRMEEDTVTRRRACGHNEGNGCSSIIYPVSNTNYSHVCGRAHGYQFGQTDAFWQSILSNAGLDSLYVSGLSITQRMGDLERRHLWSLAAGVSEDGFEGLFTCPCIGDAAEQLQTVPSFVGEHYFCETGFTDVPEMRIAWEDPLWDGSGCKKAGNKCCDRHSWFYRQVNASTADIEVRWCSQFLQSFANVFTDQLEIWVL